MAGMADMKGQSISVVTIVKSLMTKVCPEMIVAGSVPSEIRSCEVPDVKMPRGCGYPFFGIGHVPAAGDIDGKRFAFSFTCQTEDTTYLRFNDKKPNEIWALGHVVLVPGKYRLVVPHDRKKPPQNVDPSWPNTKDGSNFVKAVADL